jgi:hypothetical protein
MQDGDPGLRGGANFSPLEGPPPAPSGDCPVAGPLQSSYPSPVPAVRCHRCGVLVHGGLAPARPGICAPCEAWLTSGIQLPPPPPFEPRHEVSSC